MAKETDTLLDHNFDGIREYDNPLPRWWQWLFYITILISLIYAPYYFFGLGPSSGEMYRAEVALARKSPPAQAPAEGAGQGAGMTPPAVASLQGDAEAIMAGQSIYQATCLPCHGDKGQGVIGPNLTDNHWLHGNTYPDLVKVIANGVPDKGMIAWKATLNPTKIGQVAAFVMSLKGTNPPNPKPPQGQEYTE